MKKTVAYGLRVSARSGDRLLYTSTKPISPKKERRLLRDAFGADAGTAIARRVAEAEKIHRSCEE